MTTPAPKYSINDVVYVESSARIGFLEAYKVTNIVRSRGKWLYTINLFEKPPAETTIADMIDIKRQRLLYFDESELVDFHEALLLVKNSLDLKRNKIQILLDRYFPDGTET
jgi:hypothetical protein